MNGYDGKAIARTVMKMSLIRLLMVIVFGLSVGCGGSSNGPATAPANLSLENTATDGGGPPDLSVLQERHVAKKK